MAASITAPGLLDAADTPDFRDQLFATIADGRRRVVVDMGDTTFVDTAGIATLVDAAQCVRDMRGWLRLAAVRPNVLLTLRMSNAPLKNFTTVAAALAGEKAT